MSMYLANIFAFILGLFFISSFAPKIKESIAVFIAVPVGFSLIGMLGLVILLIHIPLNMLSVVGLSVALLLYLIFKGTRNLPSAEFIGIAFVILMLLTLLVDLTQWIVLTQDSQTMLVLGRSLIFSENLNDEFVRQASSVGPLAMVLMGFSELIDRDVWVSLTPVNVVFMYLGLLLVSIQLMGSRAFGWMALVLGFFVLAPQATMFTFYVHSNPLAGACFSFALALFWLYDEVEEWGYLILGIFLLSSYALIRFEGPIFFAATLAFIVPHVRPPDSSRFQAVTLATSLLIFSWNLYMAFNKGSGIEGFSNSNQIYILSFAAVAPIFYLPLYRIFNFDSHKMPLIISVCFTLVVTALAISKPGFILGGSYYVSSILFHPQYWGLFWIVAVPLCLISFRFIRSRMQHTAFHFILTYFLIICAFGYFRDITYQPIWTDSAVRMTFHIGPFLCLYLAYTYWDQVRSDGFHS